jgi:hypothetical protein
MISLIKSTWCGIPRIMNCPQTHLPIFTVNVIPMSVFHLPYLFWISRQHCVTLSTVALISDGLFILQTANIASPARATLGNTYV